MVLTQLRLQAATLFEASDPWHYLDKYERFGAHGRVHGILNRVLVEKVRPLLPFFLKVIKGS